MIETIDSLGKIHMFIILKGHLLTIVFFIIISNGYCDSNTSSKCLKDILNVLIEKNVRYNIDVNPSAIKSCNEKITKIVKDRFISKEKFSRYELFSRIIDDLSIEEAFAKLVQDFGESYAGYILKKFKDENIDPNLLKLFADPSISNRGDQFVDFIKNTSVKGDIFDIRNAFRESLGKKRVYRIAYLDDATAANIQKEGFISNAARSMEDGDINDLALWPLGSRVYRHVAGANTSTSNLVSVSEHETVAKYAATKFVEESDPRKKEKLFLFTMEIDEFELIRPSWNLSFDSVNSHGSYQFGDSTFRSNDPGVEMLIEYGTDLDRTKFIETRVIEKENIPEFKWHPPKGLDKCKTISDEVFEMFKDNITDEKFMPYISELEGAEIIIVDNLHQKIGKNLVVGKTKHHPDYSYWRGEGEHKQPVFVDREIVHDEEKVKEVLSEFLK